MKHITLMNTGEAVGLNSGSSLLGYVKATYAEIVEMFGEPPFGPGGDGKVNVEWHLEFRVHDDELETDDIYVATIYDWKEPEIPMDNYEWHIGGFSHNTFHVVQDYILEQKRARSEN